MRNKIAALFWAFLFCMAVLFGTVSQPPRPALASGLNGTTWTLLIAGGAAVIAGLAKLMLIDNPKADGSAAAADGVMRCQWPITVNLTTTLSGKQEAQLLAPHKGEVVDCTPSPAPLAAPSEGQLPTSLAELRLRLLQDVSTRTMPTSIRQEYENYRSCYNAFVLPGASPSASPSSTSTSTPTKPSKSATPHPSGGQRNKSTHRIPSDRLVANMRPTSKSAADPPSAQLMAHVTPAPTPTPTQGPSLLQQCADSTLGTNLQHTVLATASPGPAVSGLQQYGIDLIDLAAALRDNISLFDQVVNERVGSNAEDDLLRAQFLLITGDIVDQNIRAVKPSSKEGAAGQSAVAIPLQDIINNCIVSGSRATVGCLTTLNQTEQALASDHAHAVACSFATRNWLPTVTATRRIFQRNKGPLPVDPDSAPPSSPFHFTSSTFIAAAPGC